MTGTSTLQKAECKCVCWNKYDIELCLLGATAMFGDPIVAEDCEANQKIARGNLSQVSREAQVCQLASTPVINICVGAQVARAKIKHDFWSAYLAELTIWPAFQTWNFAKVRWYILGKCHAALHCL